MQCFETDITDFWLDFGGAKLSFVDAKPPHSFAIGENVKTARPLGKILYMYYGVLAYFGSINELMNE